LRISKNLVFFLKKSMVVEGDVIESPHLVFTESSTIFVLPPERLIDSKRGEIRLGRKRRLVRVFDLGKYLYFLYKNGNASLVDKKTLQPIRKFTLGRRSAGTVIAKYDPTLVQHACMAKDTVVELTEDKVFLRDIETGKTYWREYVDAPSTWLACTNRYVIGKSTHYLPGATKVDEIIRFNIEDVIIEDTLSGKTIYTISSSDRGLLSAFLSKPSVYASNDMVLFFEYEESSQMRFSQIERFRPIVIDINGKALWKGPWLSFGKVDVEGAGVFGKWSALIIRQEVNYTYTQKIILFRPELQEPLVTRLDLPYVKDLSIGEGKIGIVCKEKDWRNGKTRVCSAVYEIL